MRKTCVLGLPLLILIAMSACSSEEAFQQILGRSVQAPVFLSCQPVSPTEVVFTFSHPVRVRTLNFDNGYQAAVLDEGEEVLVAFTEPPGAGRRITADILVEDEDRNSLNVIVPFRARNDNMPVMVFNELRFDYASAQQRVELIEFFVLEAGNLGAMRLFIAHQSLTEPFYEFPPVEVKAGEYIVLHLRTLNENSVDETGDNLALSPGNEARPDARDFWIPGNRKYLHTPNGLWLMDQDDNIIDALLLSHSPESDGSHRTFMAAAEFLGRNRAWLPTSGEAEEGWIPGPADAASTRGVTATRTLNRDEAIPHARRAGNWYVTVTSGMTPGGRNDIRRHN